MNKQFLRIIKQTSIIGILSIMVCSIQAQSAYDAIHIMDREIGLGTRALAMGGAYAGLADDYTAIYWNPAGLGTIQKYELFTEISNLNFANDALFANKWTSYNQTYTRFRSIGLAVPIPTKRGSFVLAFGYNRILDFDENLLFSGFSDQPNGLGFTIADDNEATDYYPFEKDVQRSVQVSNEGGLHQWSLGGAIALSPNFLLGITAAYTSGNEQYRYTFIQTDSDNIYQQYPGDFNQYKINQFLQSDYSALSLKIGGLIRLSHGLKIGGAITIPSGFVIKEVHSSNDELTFDDGFIDATDETGQWEYEVTKPFYFDGGLSYNSRFITLAASARYRDWSQTRFDVHSRNLKDTEYQEFLEENNQIRLNYKSTIEYHLGSEINLEKIRTKIRGGYALYPSPLRNVSRNRDRQYLTGGISFTIDKYVSLDITYLYGTWERETRDSYTPSGTIEDITVKTTLVSISYKF
ncbi:MAG: hypothetical protein IIB95_10455 [Candidatus Marinimicrobia bacterium]|nr:hypothetical protein [Candidatus Neomarinimicrobiota bacterium]